MAWKAYAENNFYSHGPELRFGRAVEGKFAEVADITFVEVEDGMISPVVRPPISGPDAVSFMQAIMDAAYEYGLRPSKAQDERHINEHLQDMRDISKHLLKMNKG